MLRRGAARKYVLALVAAACAFVCLFVVQRFMLLHGLRSDTTYLDETLIAAIVAVLVFTVEQSHDDDMRRLQELERLTSDLNHHIRNALQVLANSRPSLDSESSQYIASAIARIEWTLNEVLAHRVERLKTTERSSPDRDTTVQ
jgi:hypothetical protein